MDNVILFLCCSIISTIFPADVFSQSGADVNSLLTKLFVTNTYNKNVRPMTNQSEPLNIDVEFFLNSVIEFDEQEESLKTSGYLSLYWSDEYLRWTPGSENDVIHLFIPQDDIWRPDVSLRNTFKSFTGLGASYLKVFVEHTGVVEWKPYQVLQSTCSVDISYFPFDTQSCDLKFTAWSYTKNEVVLREGSKGVELEDYVENSQWELVETSARETNTDEAAVFFTLKLRRRPNFYIINAILPVVFLSVLNVFTFLLPVSSGERASYAITVFLSFAVFMTIIAGELPKNSQKTSLLEVYLMLLSSLSTVIVMLSIAEVRLAARDENKTPISNFFRTFLNVLRFLTCKKCRKSVNPADASLSKSNLHSQSVDLTNNTWMDVCDAMDVVFFWFSLLFTFLCTLGIAIVAYH